MKVLGIGCSGLLCREKFPETRKILDAPRLDLFGSGETFSLRNYLVGNASFGSEENLDKVREFFLEISVPVMSSYGSLLTPCLRSVARGLRLPRRVRLFKIDRLKLTCERSTGKVIFKITRGTELRRTIIEGRKGRLTRPCAQ